MPTIHTKDDIYLDIPDGMAPDAPEVREAVAAERAGRRQRSPEFKAKVAAQEAEDRETYDPTKGSRLRLPGTDITIGGDALGKAAANVGAGVDSAWQGFKQMMPGMKGANDEQVLEKRARDQRLSDSTDMGIGADWMPTAGKLGQFAGEMLPTLAIPAGALTGAGSRAVTAAAPRLARAVQAAVGGPVRAGAAAGAAGGALMPTTSDESRLMNTGVGAAAGALLPGAVAAYKAGRTALTGAGARESAGRMMGVDHNTPLPADPAAMSIRGAENVPLSTAATYGDEGLAGLELASRGGGRPTADAAWSNLDRSTRNEVWKNVEEGTQRAGTEGERRAERATNWQERETRAMDNVQPRKWKNEVARLRFDIDEALRSPPGEGEMRPILTEIQRQLEKYGDNFTPEMLAGLRSRMNGKVRGSPTDPFTSAPMQDPFYQSLRGAFDRILTNVTGGRWSQLPKGYARDSIPVSQAKAETAVQSHFQTPEGTPRISAPEGVPEVTEAGLRKAITGPEMLNKRGVAPTFAPDSERVLKGTLQALESKNITQRAKKTTTGGGGTNTTPLANAVARLDPSNATGMIHKAVVMAQNFGHQRALRELDQALVDPQHYYQIVQETIAAGRPMTDGQRMFMQAMSAGAGTAAPSSLQAEPQR